MLGPALTAIGRTAAEHFSPLQVAKPEMHALSDEFDVVCGAYFLEGDIMHLRDRTSSASHIAYPVQLGTRMKLRSAQVAAYCSWSPGAAEAWLEAATPRPAPDRIALMFEAITAHGGVVNQMIGDGLMAIFGAPLPLPDPALSAVRAAMDMQEMIGLFNAERVALQKSPIRIGVGIATRSASGRASICRSPNAC